MADQASRDGDRYSTAAIREYVNSTHVAPDAALTRAFAVPEGIPAIQVGPSEGRLLYLLLRLANAKRVVEVSGVAEIVAGLAVLPSRTRSAAGVGLIALLAAVFPANVYMARNPAKFKKIPAWALYARLPLQPLMMWWAWRATKPS